jgi:lipopolysaccharide/colanic/teichoic acid biosynthesis glycosyltransferase
MFNRTSTLVSTLLLRLKRLFDLALSVTALILLSPLLLLTSLLIRLTSRGPVLFRQQRIGLHGRPFTIIKFRTMTTSHTGNTITIKGESRITPLGAWLRKTKIDELPELWNILKGEMSFVGPRPDVPGYADKLTGDDRLILTVKPGLTGAASLIYCNEDERLSLQPDPLKYNDELLYPDKVRIDKNYIRNWSLLLDLKIIFLTLLNPGAPPPLLLKGEVPMFAK